MSFRENVQNFYFAWTTLIHSGTCLEEMLGLGLIPTQRDKSPSLFEAPSDGVVLPLVPGLARVMRCHEINDVDAG